MLNGLCVLVCRTSEDELRRVRREELDHQDQLRNALEDELDRERAERAHTERRAQAEIERLQREVEALRKARPREKVRSEASSSGQNVVNAA